jgi:hypothetical protein
MTMTIDEKIDWTEVLENDRRRIENARKKRGRPPLSIEHKMVRVLNQGLTKISALLDVMLEDPHRIEAWLQNQKGGRPADRALNRSLVEGAVDARRRGIKLRDFVKEFIKCKLDGAATPEEVSRYERQINRLLGSKSRPNIKKRVLSEKPILKKGSV